MHIHTYIQFPTPGPQTSIGSQPDGNWAAQATGKRVKLHLCMLGLQVAHVKPSLPRYREDNFSSKTSFWSQKGWGPLLYIAYTHAAHICNYSILHTQSILLLRCHCTHKQQTTGHLKCCWGTLSRNFSAPHVDRSAVL